MKLVGWRMAHVYLKQGYRGWDFRRGLLDTDFLFCEYRYKGTSDPRDGVI